MASRGAAVAAPRQLADARRATRSRAPHRDLGIVDLAEVESGGGVHARQLRVVECLVAQQLEQRRRALLRRHHSDVASVGVERDPKARSS